MQLHKPTQRTNFAMASGERRLLKRDLTTVGLAVGIVVSSTLNPASAASGTNLIVTTTADTVGVCPSPTNCSLRSAISAANTTPGADTITIAAGTYVLSIANKANLTNENDNATGDLDINDSVTINGSGAITTIIDGARLDRVLHVRAGTVTLSSVTIRHGLGGGIENAGSLTLNGTTVSGNTWGSGIFNRGTMTLTDSAVTGNHGGNGAGGIYNFFATAILNFSTVSGNWAGGQGGIRNTGGPMTLNNSTVSGNKATHNAVGGILNDCATSGNIATLTLNNSTVSGNSAVTLNGGILNLGGGACGSTVTLSATVPSPRTALATAAASPKIRAM